MWGLISQTHPARSRTSTTLNSISGIAFRLSKAMSASPVPGWAVKLRKVTAVGPLPLLRTKGEKSLTPVAWIGNGSEEQER